MQINWGVYFFGGKMSEEVVSNEMENELKSVNSSLKEISILMQMIIGPEFFKCLKKYFSSSDEMMVYQFSDGKLTSKDISSRVNVSEKTISNWWLKWASNFGIVETHGYRNPYKAKYSLIQLAYQQMISRILEEKNEK
jgi:hypothetical protein